MIWLPQMRCRIEKFQQQTLQNPPPEQSFHNDSFQQQTVQVPALLVPELSVSPRTKTVQVVRQVKYNPGQSQPALLQTMAPSRAVPLPTSSQQTTAKINIRPIDLNRQSIGSNILAAAQNGSLPLQSDANDILRKPSLYKIPPWPSPLASPHPPQYMSDTTVPSSTLPNRHLSHPRLQDQTLVPQSTCRPAIADTVHNQQLQSKETQVISYAPGAILSTPSAMVHDQRSLHPVQGAGPSQTTPSSRQRANTSFSPYPSSGQSQLNQCKRKYSPNLYCRPKSLPIFLTHPLTPI